MNRFSRALLTDREALVARNQAMARAFHTLSAREIVRRGLINIVARAPIEPTPYADRERILLIRPDHLGDALLTTPAIRALREALPAAELHVLAGAWSAAVFAGFPTIDWVLTLPFPGFNRTPKTSLRSPYQLALQASRWLRRIGYTRAIVFRPDHWWGAMVAHWAGIEQRIGYDHPDTAPFLTRAIPLQHEHVVLQSARLIEPISGTVARDRLMLRYPVDETERAWIDGYLEGWGITPDQPIVAVHPGSGAWVKAWDERAWAEVADTLAEQWDAAVVITGSDGELALARRIAGQMRVVPSILAGETPIGTLAALFARARVVLGPDSGPLHLAVAVGTPTVALFGPADPEEFGSWGDPERHRILTTPIGCRPCRVLDWGGDDPANHPCVREISIARVLDAARRAAAAKS